MELIEFLLPVRRDLLITQGSIQPRKVRVAFRAAYASTTTFDDRVEFTRGDIDVIIAHVRNRIFVKGINANGEQMERAKSYPPPRGLYRYVTGDLYRSIRMEVVTPGVLRMSWEYPAVILGALEERYGPIFEWSDTDEAFVDKVAAGILREMQLPEDGRPDAISTSRAAAREAERAAKAAAKEAAKKEAAAARERKADAAKVREEVEEKIAQGKEVEERIEKQAEAARRPTRQEEESGEWTGVAPTFQRVLNLSRFYRLTPGDINTLIGMIRNRIIRNGQTATGGAIPAELRRKLTRETLDSIRVLQPPNQYRTVVLQYSLRNPALLRDPEVARVFAWSQAEINAMKGIINRHYREQGDSAAVVVTRLS